MPPDTNKLPLPTTSDERDVESTTRERLAALRCAVGSERFVSPAKKPKLTQEEWSEFILSVAGSLPDPSFRRHEGEPRTGPFVASMR